MNAIQSPQSTTLATLSIKDTVLAQFQEVEPDMIALADRYRDVVYDVATPRGMKDAVAARADLRDNGRLRLTRAETRIKGEVNDLKRVMADEVERLVAIVRPVEDGVGAQIKAEEERKAAERAERERLEAERVARHRAGIDKLHSYVARAGGQPVAAIESAIQALSDIAMGPEWEEFAEAADAARLTTIESLQKMVIAERQRLENERQRLENERQAAAMAAERAELERMRAELEAQRLAAAVAADAASKAEAVAAAAAEAAQAPAEPEPAAATEPEFVEFVEPAAPQPLARVIPVAQPEPAGATLTLGQIGSILGFNLGAAFLSSLGIESCGRERAAMLYRESDLPRICDALIERIARVRATAIKAA